MLASSTSISSSGTWALSYHPLNVGIQTERGCTESTPKSLPSLSTPDNSSLQTASVSPVEKAPLPWYRASYFHVLIALFLGIVVGHFFPRQAQSLKPLADVFSKLLRLMIAPTIFCTVVHGIGSMGDMRRLGKTGLRALLYFEIVSTLALVIGLVVVNLVKPGVGLDFDVRSLDRAVSQDLLSKAHAGGHGSFLLNIIPSSFLGAFASGELTQVLFVSILTALSISMLPGGGQAILHVIESGGKLCMSMMGLIVKLAPLGAFGAMGYTIGHFGVSSLGKLALLMLCFYVTAVLFVGLILGGILRWAGGSLPQYLAYIKEEILLVLGTCSSETALPSMMRKLEKLGCSKATVGLVIPTGFSFNLDGTNIYLTMAVLFLAQATNTPLDLSQQVGLLLASLITSKGSAAVVGAGFITLAATVQTVPSIPIESLAILVGVDRFMGEGRAITNLIGNGIATLAISHWEGELAKETLRQNLRSHTS